MFSRLVLPWCEEAGASNRELWRVTVSQIAKGPAAVKTEHLQSGKSVRLE